MDAKVLIAIVVVVAVAVATGLFLAHTRRKHPEQTAGHQGPDPLGTAQAPPIGTQDYPGVDRPAGPDAEAQAPEAHGSAPTTPPRSTR